MCCHVPCVQAAGEGTSILSSSLEDPWEVSLRGCPVPLNLGASQPDTLQIVMESKLSTKYLRATTPSSGGIQEHEDRETPTPTQCWDWPWRKSYPADLGLEMAPALPASFLPFNSLLWAEAV